MKRGKAPNARQKRWHDAVAQLPCCACGATPVHIHHCVGSTTKHNKVWIGQDWVIPLCYECHQGPGGVHGDMSRINDCFAGEQQTRKEFEKGQFRWLPRILIDCLDIPPGDVFRAIMDYHK